MFLPLFSKVVTDILKIYDYNEPCICSGDEYIYKTLFKFEKLEKV